MTLQSSGNIALSEIQTEFGGTNPISMNEYYSAAANVPASGAIKFSDFYGTSALPAAYIKAFYVYAADFVPVVTTATWCTTKQFNTGIYSSNVSAYNYVTTGNTADYDLRVTRLTGSSIGNLTGITNAVWTNISSTISVSYTTSPGSGLTRTIYASVEIRYNSNGTLISSNTCEWRNEAL